MKHGSWIAAGLLASSCLPACVSRGPGPPPPGTTAKPSPEDQDPVMRAERFERDGKLDLALAELEKALEDDPKNARARYRYAYYLYEKGEFRGAVAEYKRTLELDSREVPAPICLERLGDAHARLGEHQAALDDYRKAIDAERDIEERIRRDPSKAQLFSQPGYAELPRGSPLPYIKVAHMLIFLGDMQSALRSLDEARARAPRDPRTEYWTVRAYQAQKDDSQATVAARHFLEYAGNDPAYETEARELRAYVRAHAPVLTPQEKAVCIDCVRTALRPRLPGDEPSDDGFFAEHAVGRLLDIDDRAVFVTVIPRDARAPRLRGRGKGSSLATALKGAVAAIRESPRFEAARCLHSAIRIDVARGEPEPITLVPTEYAPLDEPLVLALAAKPAVEPGIHGVVLRTGEREVFCLPGDAVTEDLPDVKAMLEYAARDAGLEARAWERTSARVFRFRTDSFVSIAEGASPQDVVRGETLPFPEATAETCAEGAALGAFWLASDLVLEEVPAPRTIREKLPNGEVAVVTTLALARFHYEYRARADRYDEEKYNEVRHAAAALALADAHARTRRLELRDAAELCARWLEERCRKDNDRVVCTGQGSAPLGLQALLLALEDALAASAPAGSAAQAEERRALADGLARTIVASMRDDGSFPEYVPVPGQFTPPDRDTRFYTGESILALVRHARSTGERPWLDAAIKGAERRIAAIKASDEAPLDAWLARAIAEMDEIESLDRDPGQEARRAFGLAIARAMIDHQRGPSYKGEQPDDATGGMAAPDESFPLGMPTASLGEGLAAMARVARVRKLPEARELCEAARSAASFALRHQYTARSSFYLPSPERARGGFRSVLTSSKVRIDGNAHNVELLLLVERLLRD